VGSLVHHRLVAGVSGGLAGVAPGGQFRGNFFTVIGGKGEETFGILTGGKWGRCDDGGASTSMSGGSSAWSSVGGQHGREWSELMRGLGPWCGDSALGQLL
jgi:hypothetical protein